MNLKILLKTVKLNEDVYSNFDISDRNRKPCGKRGEEVTVIHKSLPALIVERKNGERFSVNIERITFKENNNEKK